MLPGAGQLAVAVGQILGQRVQVLAIALDRLIGDAPRSTRRYCKKLAISVRMELGVDGHLPRPPGLTNFRSDQRCSEFNADF